MVREQNKHVDIYNIQLRIEEGWLRKANWGAECKKLLSLCFSCEYIYNIDMLLESGAPSREILVRDCPQHDAIGRN